MSNRWPAGIIRKTPVTPAGPLQNGAASGVWSLADAAYWTKQGLWPTAGNFLAVEDVFSTWLYTGNSSTQTITNGIDLAGKGGLVWTKTRNNGGSIFHNLFDTVRGKDKYLFTNATDAELTETTNVASFNSNGFSLLSGARCNSNLGNFASWTFREAPNFFDVVTYTGTGANRNIAHNLGSVPGMILVKRTSSTATAWAVYQRNLGNTQYTVLNTTAAVATSATRWNNTTPTATEFTVGTGAEVNASGSTYVAYLFAHNAGGFGPSGTDSVISCNSYTGNGSATGPIIDLGWEPQWLMIKRVIGGTGNWVILDNMRGLPVGSPDAILLANSTTAETSSDYVSPTATGFQIVTTSTDVNASGSSYVYMAIRRGPMKTPTLGTSVFAPSLGVSTAPTVPTGFVTDFGFITAKTGGGPQVNSRLTGATYLTTVSTAAEAADANSKFDYMNGWYASSLSSTFIGWSFRRAPSFFDEVCYTGTGVAGQQNNHNLGVVPELMIVKARSVGPTDWQVYCQYLGTMPKRLVLNSATGVSTSDHFYAAPTATVFYANNYQTIGQNGVTYVNYLFASCPGVSKVGSYTGNGSSQTINCAFTTGARFVLIKRTDSTGDWYVWDSARGIVAGNDPYLALNTTAAEVTTDDSVDTDNTGFIVNQVAASNVNVNAATYIFLAIA
jgi:hypothetical protein